MKRLIPFLLLLCFLLSSCGADSSSSLFQQSSETESSQQVHSPAIFPHNIRNKREARIPKDFL